jgi:hypothetical protein
MANDTETDRELDTLLSEAGKIPPAPDLAARVLADAATIQAQAARAAPARRRGGPLRSPPRLVAALGGWGGFGGVTAAGLVGLAIGFWSPEAVDALSGGQFWMLTSGGAWTPDLAELALEPGDV